MSSFHLKGKCVSFPVLSFLYPGFSLIPSLDVFFSIIILLRVPPLHLISGSPSMAVSSFYLHCWYRFILYFLQCFPHITFFPPFPLLSSPAIFFLCSKAIPLPAIYLVCVLPSPSLSSGCPLSPFSSPQNSPRLPRLKALFRKVDIFMKPVRRGSLPFSHSYLNCEDSFSFFLPRLFLFFFSF